MIAVFADSLVVQKLSTVPTGLPFCVTVTLDLRRNSSAT